MSSEESEEYQRITDIPEGFDSVTAYQAVMRSESDEENKNLTPAEQAEVRTNVREEAKEGMQEDKMDVDADKKVGKGARPDLKRKRAERSDDEDDFMRADTIRKLKKGRSFKKGRKIKRMTNIALNPDWFDSSSAKSESSGVSGYAGSLYSQGPIEVDHSIVKKRAKSMMRKETQLKMMKERTGAKTQIDEEISKELYYQYSIGFNDWCENYDVDRQDQVWLGRFVNKLKECTGMLSEEDKLEIWDLIAIPPYVKLICDPNTRNDFIVSLINDMQNKKIGHARRDVNAFISSKVKLLKEILMYGCILITIKTNEMFNLDSAIDLYSFLVDSENRVPIKIKMKWMYENMSKDPKFEPEDLFPDVQFIFEHYKSQWHSKTVRELMNHTICGWCGSMTDPYSHRYTYIYQKNKSGKFKHDKVYIKKERIKNELKERNRNHRVKEVKDKGKEIGCYVCCLCSNNLKGDRKFRKKFPKPIEWISNETEFKETPECIKKLPYRLHGYLNFGSWFPMMSKSEKNEMWKLTKDVKGRWYNGTLGYIMNTNMDEVTDKDAELIEECVKFGKKHNPLYSKRICNWEALKIKKELQKNPPEVPKNIGINFESVEEYIGLDEMWDKLDKNDYYFYVSCEDVLKEYKGRYLRTFEDIDERYRLYMIKKGKPKPSDAERFKFQKDHNSLLWFADEYLEESLFVALFPYGEGGYNSTYKKTMSLHNYWKMRFNSGITDKFRRSYFYTFYMHDWILKDQIYNYNKNVNFWKLKDFYYKTEDVEFDQVIGENDPIYYKLIGSTVPAKLKHSKGWQCNHLQSVEAMIREFGRPDLFVTCTMNPNDPELKDYLKETWF
jgi:hypothetical protein